MFERKGYVRVGVGDHTKTEASDADSGSQVEELIESALEASAEDFEELHPAEDCVELEVRFFLSFCFWFGLDKARFCSYANWS